MRATDSILTDEPGFIEFKRPKTHFPEKEPPSEQKVPKEESEFHEEDENIQNEDLDRLNKREAG